MAEMRFSDVRGLLIVLFLCAMSSSNDDPKYYEIENNERKVEYDNWPTPALPEAESYVIGVKRALLPFRQLSKYLKRPVADTRTANGLPGIQWRIIPPNDAALAAPDRELKTQNQKRWDKSDSESSDGDTYYPEIILIRPINVSKLGSAKIDNINKGLDEAMKARRQPEIPKSNEEVPKCLTKLQTTAGPDNQKKLKIDHQIFQGNGINIKLTFSVDVGNQSKTIESNNTKHHQPGGPSTATKGTTIKFSRRVSPIH